MSRMIRLSAILMVAMFIALGCSGNDQMVTAPGSGEEGPRPALESNSERVLWGLWDINFDADALTAEIVPIRNPEAHFDVTNMLLPPKCDDCVKITITGFDLETRILEVYLTLRNPTLLTGYDVHGILFTDYAGHLLQHPDGWTSLWDIPGGETINPFLSYNWYGEKYGFKPGAEHNVVAQIYIPVPPNWGTITFAVDASWPSNCKEPFGIYGLSSFSTIGNRSPEYNIYQADGAKAHVTIEIGDWQDDVDAATFRCPEICGDEWLAFEKLSDNRWNVEITNANTPEPGDYTGLIKATSENSGELATWNKFPVSVRRGWARDFGGYDPYRSVVITSSADGDTYVAGDVTGYSDFDPSPYEDIHKPSPIDDDGLFLAKFDYKGDYQWALTWEGKYIHDIALDSAGNIYVTGSFAHFGQLDPANDDDIIETAHDIFLIKFNPDGQQVWGLIWGGQYSDKALGVAVDSADNIYVVGDFMDVVDMDPGPGVDEHKVSDFLPHVFISKFNANGEFQWARSWGNSGWINCWDVSPDASGNVYAVGTFRTTVDFDPGPGVEIHSSEDVDSMFLSKFDSDGNFLWVNIIGEPGSAVGGLLAIGNADEVYISGGFDDTVDFDPGPGVEELTSLGKSDSFLCELDSNGELQWVISLGNELDDYLMYITLDSAGNLYLAGEFRQTMDFDPGPGIEEHEAEHGYEAYLVKLYPNSEFQWVRIYSGYGSCELHDVAVGDDDNVYLAGSYNGEIFWFDFDPGPGTDLHWPFGGSAFLTKLPPDGNW